MRLSLPVILVALPVAGAAQEVTLTVNGHEIAVVHPGGGVLRDLVVDGETVLAEQFWIGLPEAPAEVGGLPVMVFETHPGGNACEGPMPLVVVLPPGGPATFWGPLDNCAPVTTEIGGDAIVFASEYGEPEVVWSPKGGFRAPGQ